MASSPIPSTNTMDIRSLLQLMWRRRFATLFAVQLGVLYFIFQVVTQPTEYFAQANLLIRENTLDANETRGIVSDYDGGSADNESRLIQGSVIGSRVMDKIGYYPVVVAKGVPNTQFLTISATDKDPQRARKTAQTVAEVYQAYRLESVVTRIEHTIEQLAARVPEVQARIEGYDKQIAALQDGSITRETLSSLRSSLLSTVNFYNQRIGELSVSSALATGGISILEPATVPGHPRHESKVPMALSGFALAVAVGLLLIAALELFDDRVRDAEDILNISNVPVLGVIPSVRSWRSLKTPALFTQTEHSQHAGEAYRALRVALLHALSANRSQVVQFTSPRSRAGKTTTVANLGAILGWSGKPTVVVDLDLRSPKLSLTFGAARMVGFSEVVNGHSLWKAVEETAQGTLSILPAGSVDADPSETIGRSEMPAVLKELSGRFDVVLVDSGALSPFSDALVAVQSTGCVVLIAREGRTRKRDFSEAVDSIRTSGGTVIGCVLTASQSVRMTRSTSRLSVFSKSAVMPPLPRLEGPKSSDEESIPVGSGTRA